MKQFYTYMWLREDGTPYYVGKGQGKRAFRNGCPTRAVIPEWIDEPDMARIVVYPMGSEAESFEAEIALIWYYGRKDTGAGCLRNLTDGGEGVAGNNKPKTLEHRLNIGKAHKGMKRSARARANIAKAGVGTHNHTEEWKKQHSECLKGRKRPPRSKEWVENYKHSMKEYWERNK